jgi:hypothetical protein
LADADHFALVLLKLSSDVLGFTDVVITELVAANLDRLWLF